MGERPFYSYTTDDGNKVFIDSDQAWEISQQRMQHQYAVDLLHTLRTKHSNNEVYNELVVEDLIPFAGKLEDMLEQEKVFGSVYDDCCEAVIDSYVADAFGVNAEK